MSNWSGTSLTRLFRHSHCSYPVLVVHHLTEQPIDVSLNYNYLAEMIGSTHKYTTGNLSLRGKLMVLL